METSASIPSFVSSTPAKNAAINTKNTIVNKSKQLLANVSTRVEGAGSTTIFKGILVIILLGILIFLAYVFYTYLQADCVVKKDFLTYFFDMEWNRPCSLREETILVPPPSQTNNVPVPSNQTPILSDITNRVDELLERKEVFHISDQVYTFEEAKCKCASYGATLATEEQLADAYNKGAHWCSYGWSAGQKALYPIQSCIWKTEKCGKPGINGGYFPNANLRFGINCYGKKPKGTVLKPVDEICASSDKQVCAQSNVQKNAGDTISPFKPTLWSQATGMI